MGGFSMLSKATEDEINSQDFTEGWTPLHWAVLSDNPKGVIWLLKHGADKTIKDFAGRTAEDLVSDHWAELYMRYVPHFDTKKKETMVDPVELKELRMKQMREAFKQSDITNKLDSE